MESSDMKKYVPEAENMGRDGCIARMVEWTPYDEGLEAYVLYSEAQAEVDSVKAKGMAWMDKCTEAQNALGDAQARIEALEKALLDIVEESPDPGAVDCAKEALGIESN